MAKLTVVSPVENIKHPSGDPTGSTINNGEPGLPKRTSGGTGVPEVTYDKSAPLPAPKGK